MHEIYLKLNDKAKEYLTKELDNIFYEKYHDEELLKRCYKEINILYDRGLLFIIEYLYKYKQKQNGICYYFKGTINNLLLLYILNLTKVDPIKYNLPYELCDCEVIDIKIKNGVSADLVKYLDKCDDNIRIVMGSHVKEDIEEVKKLFDDYYLLIPSSAVPEDILLKINPKYFILETVEDYRKYTKRYLSIKISEEKKQKNCKNIGLENVIDEEIEYKISSVLKPKTLNDYIKIKSISYSVHSWNLNQEQLFKKGIININSLVSNREDILDYLVNHSIDREIALEIAKYIGNGRIDENSYLWNKYIKIMKKNECDDEFINIISKILYIRGRGEAVNECLFILDKDNDLEMECDNNE